jgi:hypothetical protein
MNNLPKKYKEFSYTKYYRGIELTTHCVTTSLNKFAELIGSNSSIKGYTHSYSPTTPECIENPNVVYACIGMGGEGTYVFERNKFFTLAHFKEMIDKHRETHSSYRDYLKNTGQE